MAQVHELKELRKDYFIPSGTEYGSSGEGWNCVSIVPYVGPHSPLSLGLSIGAKQQFAKLDLIYCCNKF